ncbi:MAG: hypothetical protein F9K45_11390, partial [Melioribacteraceae bacterium]
MNPQHVILIALLIVSIYKTCSAQILPGAKQIALSHADVAGNEDVFSVFNNPAGLSKVSGTQVGIYYSPSPFGLKQLENGFGAITKNFVFVAAAAGFSTYGFELYKENKITLSFAKNITENFSAGVSVFYHNLQIKNYGNDNTISLTFGCNTNLSENLILGFAAQNITRSTYGNESNHIPTLLRTGLSYSIQKNLIVHFAFEKEIENPLSLRFGIDY